MNQSLAPTARRRDVRPLALALLVVMIVAVGNFVQWQGEPQRTRESNLAARPSAATEPFLRQQHSTSEEAIYQAPPLVDPATDPSGHMRQAAEQQFQTALALQKAGRFEEAASRLQRLADLRPNDANVLTNLGFALLGNDQYPAAYAAFDRATDINPGLANAYYGAAMALEGMGDLEAALSGMRSFLHTTDMGPEKLWVARARSAIWEWEARLERGPWGPTKGIPPGFTADELKRDGQGVGIKMPIPGTEDENGFTQYEIKHQDKFKLFDE